MKKLTEILKKLRATSGVSQKQVAADLGIGQAAYSKIENGQTPLTIPALLTIADIHEVPASHIIAELTGYTGDSEAILALQNKVYALLQENKRLREQLQNALETVK